MLHTITYFIFTNKHCCLNPARLKLMHFLASHPAARKLFKSRAPRPEGTYVCLASETNSLPIWLHCRSVRASGWDGDETQGCRHITKQQPKCTSCPFNLLDISWNFIQFWTPHLSHADQLLSQALAQAGDPDPSTEWLRITNNLGEGLDSRATLTGEMMQKSNGIKRKYRKTWIFFWDSQMLGQCWDNRIVLTIESGFGHIPSFHSCWFSRPGWDCWSQLAAGLGRLWPKPRNVGLQNLQSQSLEVMVNGDLMGI